MNIILKSAKVINVESKHNGSKQDILISEGKILKIAKKYKLSIKDLLKYNNVTEKDLLKEGKKLKIPKR